MTDAVQVTRADRRLAALFPEARGEMPRPWWQRRRGVATIAVVVVALVASGLVAADAFGNSGASYRTATVADENVDAVLTGVATIEPVTQAAVAFPVSGTVASVNVGIGDPVAAGGTLASLDTGALTRTLHAKEAALAQAQLTLSKALSGQSVGGIGNGATSGANNSAGATGSGPASATAAAFRTTGTGGNRIVLAAATGDPQLAAAQQAVLVAQQHVDAALATAATALSAETSACAAFVTPPTSTTDPPVSTTTPPTPDATACQTAISDVLSAQTAVSAAQKSLADAASALDALLASRAAQPPPTTTSPPTGGSRTGGSSSASSGSTSTSRSGATAGASGSSPSAADLVAYQRSVDAAAAAVAAAGQAVDQATIASPVAGTVVAVNMKVGDAVSAGSSTADIVVRGAGGYEVSTTLSVDQVPAVSVGQPVTVLPDATHRALTGHVVSISVMPASTSTTTTLYRVVVGLTDPGAKLDDGATGTVQIVTKQAKAALAVPTSAVTTLGVRHSVTVLEGGSPTVVAVQVGVVGTTWTQVMSGVTKGQQVVLADVSAALPNSATTSSSSTTGTVRIGGLDGFPGGGRGFPGGTNRTG